MNRPARIFLCGELLYYPNGVYMGQILMGDDGYYAWWPTPHRRGYLDEGILFEVAHLLKERNAPYDAEVKRYFARDTTP